MSEQASLNHSVQRGIHSGSVLADPLHSLWNDSSDDSSGIFGLPFAVDDAAVVIVPVPWEATCSQGTGTADAPELLLQASRFVELHDVVLGNVYERGIAMSSRLSEVEQMTREIQSLEASGGASASQIDAVSARLNTLVHEVITQHLLQGQVTGLVGGDHSVSYGSIAAHCQAYPDIGILQIDAHADLRASLDGMVWSHASVMRHVMDSVQPKSLMQVGLRALCSAEKQYQASNNRIVVHTDHEIQLKLAASESWLAICDDIIDQLPEEIYLTLDIDGLEPAYCRHTGTPVPGGLTFMQVVLLLHRIRQKGHVFRGFDLVEVGGHTEDALIAAHLLYTLCGLVEV